MKALTAFTHSEGKGHRNDDFRASFPILSTRLIVLVGDFTSDSPMGANEKMLQGLQAFVEKRIKTWREHLIPPEDVLGLIARFVNRQLQQSRDSGQTTLCACIVDSYEGSLYFVNIGDSGFGIAQNNQFQFLRKGDVAGTRDASGFLPMKTESFAIAKAPFPADARLLLFTDGFWENTAHFLPVAQAETKLAQILAADSLADVVGAFKQQILEPSNRRDDFTFIIAKEEPVAHKAGDSRQPTLEQLEAFIEKKVFEALDQQEHQKPVKPSPMEQEFLRLLGQTTTGLKSIETRVLGAVREGNKQYHMRLAKEMKDSLDVYFQTLQQLREDLERMRADLADQDFKFERKFEETEGLFGVQAIASPAATPSTGTTGNMKTENRLLKKFIEDVDISHLREVDFTRLEPRLDALEKEAGLLSKPQVTEDDPLAVPPSGWKTTSRNLKGFYTRNKWLWQGINSAVLLLILGFLIVGWWRKPAVEKPQPATRVEEVRQLEPKPREQSPKVFEYLKTSSVDAGQKFQVVWPQKLTPLTPPEDLLRFMGLSRARAQEELICLANALAKAKSRIQAAAGATQAMNEIPVPLEGCNIAGKSEFPLYIRSANSPPNATVLRGWVKPYAASESQYPPGKNLRAIWLQIHGSAKTIDGDFGNKSRDALYIILQNRFRTDHLSSFSQALE